MNRSRTSITRKLASLIGIAILLAFTLTVPSFAGQPSQQPQVILAGLDPSEIPIAVKIVAGAGGLGFVVWKIFADGHVERERFDKDKR